MSLRRLLHLLPLVLLFGETVTAVASASVIGISSIGRTEGTASAAVGKSGVYNFQEAASFSTGTGITEFESLSFYISARGSAATDFSVSLYTGLSVGGPSGMVTTLLGTGTPGVGLHTFDAPAGVLLSANSTYWVVFSAIATPASSTFQLRTTTSTAEDPGGLPGWSIGDQRWLSNNGGTSWFPSGNLIGISIAVTPVTSTPVPDSGPVTVLLAAALGTALMLGRRAARD